MCWGFNKKGDMVGQWQNRICFATQLNCSLRLLYNPSMCEELPWLPPYNDFFPFASDLLDKFLLESKKII